MNLSRLQRYLLSIISGILMVISFPYSGSLSPLIFVAWIPLLLVEHNVATRNYKSGKVFLHGFITFLIYNLGTTWWVANSTLEGAMMAFGLNTLFMAIIFHLFHLVKKRQGSNVGYFSLVFFWISFEFIHYQWELSWPWLHLGNYFSIRPSWVQWYEYTGVYGGTLWVLASNIFGLKIILRWLKEKQKDKALLKSTLGFTAILFIPLGLSMARYYSYEETLDPLNVVIIQPNIDPYNEKFVASMRSQIEKLASFADKKVNAKTDFLVAPETALPEAFFEEDAHMVGSINYLIERKKEWGLPNILIGASTARFFEQKHSRASRKIEGDPGYIEYYNTSLLIDKENRTNFVHKSLLVPGAEIIPFSDVLPFLESLALNSGGTSGSLGIEKEPQVFTTDKGKVASLICYESVCGSMLATQAKKGAEVAFVITNDGWWGNTPGYRQHASFSRLRAIETRRSIARSANTGISGIINQRGDVVVETEYWKPAVVSGVLQKNRELTFYAKHGDYLGKAFVLVSIIILLFQVYYKVRSLVK